MFVVSAIGYMVNFSLTKWTSAPQQVVQFVPAFVVGLLGNLMHKFTGKMSFDAVLLGVFFLVPGSLGKDLKMMKEPLIFHLLLSVRSCV